MTERRPPRRNLLWLAAGVAFYLALTVLIGGGVLWLTLWAYGAAEEALSDTISAAVLNTTAATLLWLAFFGGLDMFLTLWTIMQNRQMEAERVAHEAERERRAEEQRKERQEQQRREESDRQYREAERSAREAERISRAQELADQRAFQQGIIEMLTTEREQSRQEREQSRQEREQFLATLQAERERGDLLMTRFLDLAERLGNRNGNGAPGKG